MPGMFMVFFIVLAAAILFLINLLERPKREALKKLAQRFQGRVSLLTGALKGKYLGFDFAVVLVPAGKNTPPRMSLRLSKKFPFSLRIYRETPLSRLGKRMGLVREVQINDPSFDAQFLIFSNRPMQAVSFLSTNTKTFLKELFAQGFDSFNLGHRGVDMQKPDYSVSADLDPGKVEQLLQKLLSATGGTA